MPNSQKKYQLQLIILFGFIIVVCFIIFIIYPLVENTKKFSEQIKDQQAKIEETNQKKEGLEKFKKDKTNLEKISKELSSSLTSRDVLDLVMKLEEIAKKTNLTQQLQIQEKKSSESIRGEQKTEIGEETLPLKTSQPQKSEDPLGSLPSLSMSIFLNGQYKNVLNYLMRLENLTYETEIDSLTISSQTVIATPSLPSPPKETPQEKNVSVTLETRIFLKD